MIKVSNERVNILQRAIELMYDGDVRLNEYYGVWKVAWVSMGAVLPDKAADMSKAIYNIAKLADVMNFYNVRREYKPSVMDEKDEIEQTQKIVELLKNDKVDDIIQWL